jgi:predicted nuclease of restriction endonuclease-like (RecB) superfamily
MLLNNSEYFDFLNEIKIKIKNAQYRAALNVNREMILLNYNIGKSIILKSVWGNKFIENLAMDIKLEFPNMTGYSIRNLKYMKKFAETFEDFTIVQAVLAQLTWYHHIALMDKIKNYDEYLWYASKTIDGGWSRNVLVHQIEYKLYDRQALAQKTTNFEVALASPQSELAMQTIKDPYIFDFVDMKRGMIEREVEDELVKNITKLLLELGTGFAFIGNQYHLEVGGEDFFLDLLLYNLNLRCYVVVELKTGSFKPEFAGKLNFYLSVVDDLLKKDIDNPSIGLLLCKDKNKLVAEYALKDMSKPIGVSEYRLMDILPKDFEKTLPSTEDIENRIKLEMGELGNEV